MSASRPLVVTNYFASLGIKTFGRSFLVIPHPRSGANSRRAGACRQSCLSQWLRMVVMVMVKRVVLAVRLQKHTCAHFAHSHIIVHLMESNLCNTKSKDVCDIPSSHLTHTHTHVHTHCTNCTRDEHTIALIRTTAHALFTYTLKRASLSQCAEQMCC